MRVPLIYKNRPLLGFDVGSRTVKVVQLKRAGKSTKVVGYGYANFPGDAIVEGIISDPEAMATALAPLFSASGIGALTARRVAASIPVAKVFVRTLQLPPMDKSDMVQAVRLETEQYVPVPIDDLYIDFEQLDTLAKDKIEVLMVAAPRAIVDSYMKLFEVLGLEVDSLELSLAAITRGMISANSSNQTSLVVDFGSRSADFAIFDKVIRLTGTISVGGDLLTDMMVKDLQITADQANEIKYKFGIADSGLKPKIESALANQLSTISTEIKKAIKYYQERSEQKHPIQNVVLAGGSASMPGLSEYLFAQLGIPVSVGNPWQNIEIGSLPPVSPREAPMYATAIGLALREGQE